MLDLAERRPRSRIGCRSSEESSSHVILILAAPVPQLCDFLASEQSIVVALSQIVRDLEHFLVGSMSQRFFKFNAFLCGRAPKTV